MFLIAYLYELDVNYGIYLDGLLTLSYTSLNLAY